MTPNAKLTMKHIIEIEIECGENTCVTEPGNFCNLLEIGLEKDGHCFIYGKVFERDGWIIRHPECKKNALIAPMQLHAIT